MLRKLLLVICLIATVLWTSFIYSNSLKTGIESDVQSSSVTDFVNQAAGIFGIEEEIPPSTVRDMAHFAEFLILSCLLFADMTLFCYQKLMPKVAYIFFSAGIILLLCFVLACIDELLQKFSAGRACQFSDIMLDTAGALFGVLGFGVALIIIRIIKRRRTNIKE